MGIYIEAIILYIVLFFSGSTALITGTAAQATEFSATSELVRILLYCIPSLALLWYMMIKSWKLEYWAVRPGKKDLVSGLITFPCLLIIGFAIAFLASYAGDTTMKSIIRLPSSILDWIVLCTSCLLMAYLEESYFRFAIFMKAPGGF